MTKNEVKIHLNNVVQLLRQSFSGNETEVHEAEKILLNIEITCEFVSILIHIITNNDLEISIKYAALIRLTHIIKKNWLVSLNQDIKLLLFKNYFELLYSDGPKYNKLFQFYSNLIIDAVMTLNECPNIYSHILLDKDNFISSLILIKSIARHFLHSNKSDNEQFNQFCMFFLQSAFKLFVDSQSFQEVLLVFNIFYYMISNDPYFFKNLNPEVIICIITKFILFSEFQNDEIYQRCLKDASKTIRLIFEKSIVPSIVSPNLLISIFNSAFQLFSKDLKPNTRNQLTRLLCSLFNFQVITKYFFSNIQNFIESFILPFFIEADIKGDLYDETFDLYDPYHSSIFLIQFISKNQTQFVTFLNVYLAQSIQHFMSLPNTNDQNQLKKEMMILLARTKLASSSLCIKNEALLQIPLFESNIEILRVVAFTITANFNKVIPSSLFPVFLNHLTDQSNTVSQLSAVSAIKCLQNEDISFNEAVVNFLPGLFEAYLKLSQNSEILSISSSLKLLKKLLQISGSTGIFTGPILSSLVTHLIRASSDPNTDPSVANKICKRICQIIEGNSLNSNFNFSVDPFINELIMIYANFNDIYKESILSIFESSIEFCFSPTVSWKILNIFEFGVIFENEMMVLRKLLISAKIHSALCMNGIHYVLEKIICQKIGNDAYDDEIALNSLADIFSALFGLNEPNIDSLIAQKIIPLILKGIEENASVSAVSRLISCIFIFLQKSEKKIDYQPFFNFWIENAEFPYYCASSILIFQNLPFDFNLYLTILLKICDELTYFYNENEQEDLYDDFEFTEFSIETIVTNFLKLIKFLKEKLPEFYQSFHSNAEAFLDETLPQIVDNLCS